MQVGARKIKMTGHFPPTSRDPYLRMAFPRQPLGDEKTLTFALYIPGLAAAFSRGSVSAEGSSDERKPRTIRTFRGEMALKQIDGSVF